MWTTLLGNIASWFSKTFFVGSFLPVSVYLLLNGVIAYFLFESFHTWADANFLASDAYSKFGIGVIMFLGVVVVAQVFTALNNSLRRLLEGRWPVLLVNLFSGLEGLRRYRIEKGIAAAAKLQSLLSKEQELSWKKDLAAASAEGRNTVLCFVVDHNFAKTMSRLRSLRDRNQIIPYETLEDGFTKLEVALRRYDPRKKCGDRYLLSELHEEFVRIVALAREHAEVEHLRLHTEKLLTFGQTLGPTRMGNIANAVQSFTARRYGCNFDLFWSNLQMTLEKDKDVYATLTEAKTMLDFHVACTWLTALSFLLWTGILWSGSPQRLWFTIVALLGPLLCYLIYRVATAQYRSFADVVMTSFDMYRFELLSRLHVALPSDSEDERRIWEALGDLAILEESEVSNIRYAHSNK